MVICIFRFTCYYEKRDEGSFSLPQELGERWFLHDAIFCLYPSLCIKGKFGSAYKTDKIFPEAGKVSLLSVTDKQYGDIYNFWGKPKSINKSKISKKVISEPIQLEFF